MTVAQFLFLGLTQAIIVGLLVYVADKVSKIKTR